jgi:uncharacterized protein (DUF1697 family)
VAAVRKKAEAALRERFGYDAWVLAYDVDTVRAVVDAYPFEREVDGYQSYVTFVTDGAVLNELTALADNTGPDEKISPGEGVVYWQVPKGSTLDSTPSRESVEGLLMYLQPEQAMGLIAQCANRFPAGRMLLDPCCRA